MQEGFIYSGVCAIIPLTRQFAIEYSVLFDAILPTLQMLDLPVPLGGTSNHFPRRVLEQAGGWDPFNVTEDADLGIRLSRFGWRVGVLPQRTMEEAPATYRVWLGQRTRWLKGWLQTYLVHSRQPRKLWLSLGPFRFFGFQILMGGLLLSAIVHPWFYILLAYAILEGHIAHHLNHEHTTIATQALFWVGGFNLLGGYLSTMALGAAVLKARQMTWLSWHVLMMPIYWLMISVAAYRALWQLVFAPFAWEKTEHSPRPATAPYQVMASGNPS